MALVRKSSLPRIPQSMKAEVDKYLSLYNTTVPLTTIGDASWTSTSSGIVYSAPSGGQTELFSVLQVALEPYQFTANDYNSIIDELDLKLNISSKATQAEAEDGTDDTKYMTPLSTKQAVLKFAPELEYKDVTNLSATTAGVITWQLPLATDQTRTAIMLCRATKDISNMDYATCLADSSVTKNTLGKDAVTNTYTGLVNNTQYWVKAFVEYTIGGKKYYSNGVTVTFITPAVPTIEFYNAGNEFTSITGGWVQGYSDGVGIQTKNPTNLQLVTTGATPAERTWVTNDKIDFTNLSKLKTRATKFSDSSDSNLYFRIVISDTKTSRAYEDNISSQSFSYKFTDTELPPLDVSNITGSHYIRLHAYNNGFTVATSTTQIFRVWGEI